MTNLENEILDLLKEDARLSAKKIAAMLGREEKERPSELAKSTEFS